MARIYRPGVKFEIVPILSGAQGIGKSTLINKLAPDFFSDGLRGLGESKDDLQFLIGSWLLEISELSAMKTEVEKQNSLYLQGKIDSGLHMAIYHSVFLERVYLLEQVTTISI